jgi:hypothetical protein
MPLAGLAVLDLAIGSEPESLFRARFGLQLGHFAISSLSLGGRLKTGHGWLVKPAIGWAKRPVRILGRHGMPSRAARRGGTYTEKVAACKLPEAG